jgi:hypothetical protein
MKARVRTLTMLLLAIPVTALSADKPEPLSLALRDETVNRIVSDATYRPATPRESPRLRPDKDHTSPANLTAARLMLQPAFAPRRAVVFDCNALMCTEYDSKGKALRSMSREAYFATASGTLGSPGLGGACESSNDMLPTFQRFENCPDTARQLRRDANRR